MKTTYSITHTMKVASQHYASETSADATQQADVEHAESEAVRRFRALLANRQSVNLPSDTNTNTNTDADADADTDADTDTDTKTSADTNTSQNDAGDRDKATDKRSWGVRLMPPETLPPRPSASAQAASPQNSSGTDEETSNHARAEAVAHLVTKWVAKHGRIDREALPEHTSTGATADNEGIETVVSIRIDHVFPKTLLTLTISEPAISLRFQSASADSRALLSDQRSALASRVTNRTGRATQVEISGDIGPALPDA